MAARFHSFVLFAEMRTGSNFVEANLNALQGVTCLGEAFNPHFIGAPDRAELLGVTQAERERDPMVLLDHIRDGDGLCGFRYFHDHDPRILDCILDDPGWAKIILTRDPVQSYVSWKIAQHTGQWRLTDVKRRKQVQVTFDALEFAGIVAAQQRFREGVTRRLQCSGQAAFHLRYDDLQSLEVMNGLAAFLGAQDRLKSHDRSLTVQNPEPLTAKVSNPAEMQAALDALTAYDPSEAADFEPRRIAPVSTFVATPHAPLIYLPVKDGPVPAVRAWMAALDGVAEDALVSGFSHKELRRWRRAHKGHRSFTVIAHPVERAHRAFCHHILGYGPHVYAEIRKSLVRGFGLLLPSQETPDIKEHRAAFCAFLRFLRANLNGQTSLRVDPAWCSQVQAVLGFGEFAPPDAILREADLSVSLPALAKVVSLEPPDFVPSPDDPAPFTLQEVYDDEIEELVMAAYRRDYTVFGFTRWQAAPQAA